MLPIVDAEVRLVLLNHLASRRLANSPSALRSAGLEPEQIERLRALPAQELARLADMRSLTMGFTINPAGLRHGLRAIAVMRDREWLESYFLLHGASWQLMRALFRLRRKRVFSRRQELGAWFPPGRVKLPEGPVREDIRIVWKRIQENDLRLRYYRLHQEFKPILIRVLEEVIRSQEDRR